MVYMRYLGILFAVYLCASCSLGRDYYDSTVGKVTDTVTSAIEIVKSSSSDFFGSKQKEESADDSHDDRAASAVEASDALDAQAAEQDSEQAAEQGSEQAAEQGSEQAAESEQAADSEQVAEQDAEQAPTQAAHSEVYKAFLEFQATEETFNVEGQKQVMGAKDILEFLNAGLEAHDLADHGLNIDTAEFARVVFFLLKGLHPDGVESRLLDKVAVYYLPKSDLLLLKAQDTMVLKVVSQGSSHFTLNVDLLEQATLSYDAENSVALAAFFQVAAVWQALFKVVL